MNSTFFYDTAAWESGSIKRPNSDFVFNETQYRSDLIKACGVPVSLLNQNTINLTASSLPPANRDVWEFALDQIRRHRKQQFLMALVGPRGGGKSSLGCAAVLRTCKGGVEGRYTTANGYLLAFHEGQGFSAQVPQSLVLKRHVAPSLLIVDESHEVPSSERDDFAFRQLLHRRWDEGKATVVISNETPAATEKRLGLTLADRLRSGGPIVEFNWKSLRKTFDPESNRE